MKFLSDIKNSFAGGAARFSAWNKARLERIQVKRLERKAQIEADQHHHSRFFLLTVPAMATICAAVTEWCWALLFCIEATGHLDLNYEARVGSTSPLQSLWDFSFSAHWPVLIGLLLATAPIVMISMVWLPVQFGMRGAGVWRRGTLIFTGILANILVVVSGTVVMNYSRQDAVREALVVEQSADAQRTMLSLSVDDLRDELRTLMTHDSRYIATAASVGAVAYERDYVMQARATNDPRLPLLERALGSARRADELRAQIREARTQVATAAPEASTQAVVEDDVGRELNWFARVIEVWRPPFVAFICTIIGIFGSWWVLAMLERMNPRDVLRSGWADESHRIEDKRDEAPIVREPMKPAKRRYTDADTGDEIEETHVRAHKRERVIKKGVPTPIEMPRESIDVEYEGRRFRTSGAQNEEAPGQGGWGTHGPSAAPPAADDIVEQQQGQRDHAGLGGDVAEARIEQPAQAVADEDASEGHNVQNDTPEIPDLTDEEAADIEAELAAESAEEHDVQQAPETEASEQAEPELLEPSERPVTQDEPPNERAPETRPERMIAAE